MLWIYWNPNRIAFKIPYFDHPVTWYGIIFATGFLVAYFVLKSIFQIVFKEHGISEPKRKSKELTDKLVIYVALGTVIGARLGEVLFYDFNYYFSNPLMIFKTWHGGLASHGGAIGILIALVLFYRRHIKGKLPLPNFLSFLDIFCIAVPLSGAFIRLGNFINQEIVGRPSSLPWAIVFGNPAGPYSIVPRHPVQLYEGIAYISIFFLLFLIWKKHGLKLRRGLISGLFFVSVFGARFLIEFFKMPQHQFFTTDSTLLMGQILSIPFILFGVLLLKGSCSKKHLSDF